MLTLQNLRNHVTHALGGSPSTDLPPSPPDLATTTANSVADMIINSAGQHLFNMHEWNFRQRPSINLSFIASQNYVELPADFGGVISACMNDGTALIITTPEHLSYLRTTSVSPGRGGDNWATISYPGQLDPDQGQPPPRMEFWPNITAASTNAVSLTYYANWVRLYAATDAANIPGYADTLLVQLVRAFAQGWEDESVAPLEPRLDAIEKSAVCRTAKEQDGMMQSSLGKMRGGAIYSSRAMASWWSAASATASGPS